MQHQIEFWSPEGLCWDLGVGVGRAGLGVSIHHWTDFNPNSLYTFSTRAYRNVEPDSREPRGWEWGIFLQLHRLYF